MKTTIILSTLALVLSSSRLEGQGIVVFVNNTSTRISFGSKVVTPDTPGAFVPTGTRFLVALYYAPDGPDPGDVGMQNVMGSAVNPSPFAGRFNGGGRSTPTSTLPGEYAWFQVVCWETVFGTSYEEAVLAPVMNVNGTVRRAYAGRSNRFRMPTGSSAIPEQIAPSGGGRLQPFQVDIVPGNPYFTINDIAVAEGSNGTAQATFTVKLNSGDPNGTYSVDFATADGTALAGQDYVAANGTLVFNAGETQKLVSVTITADGPVEPEEDFFMDLSNPVSAFVADARGRCVITEVRITGISADILVSFNTVSNRYYIVEKSTDMTTWIGVEGATNVRGTGDIVIAADRGVGCAAGNFYRARLLP